MPDTKISDLPRATYLDDDSLLVAEQLDGAVAVEGALFKSFAREATKELADSASAAAVSANGAKVAAQSALAGVQSALDNLPAGDTLIINDLTTGGTAAALSAEMGKTLAQRRPRNLLDNSDWSNPVDQRHGYCVIDGVDYYSDPSLSSETYVGTTNVGLGSAVKVDETYGTIVFNGTTCYVAASDIIRGYYLRGAYHMDRWRTTNVVLTEIKEGYITLTCKSTVANGFYQPMDCLTAGETVTVACEDTDGNVYVGSGVVPESGLTTLCMINDAAQAYIRANRFGFTLFAGKTISLRWVALYRGAYTKDTLPPYQPKGYGAELAECMRYQIEMFPQTSELDVYIGMGVASSATRATVFAPLPAVLRAAPALTWSGTFRLSPTGRWGDGIAVTGISTAFYPSGALGLTVNTAEGLVVNQAYALIASNEVFPRSLLLDANL